MIIKNIPKIIISFSIILYDGCFYHSQATPLIGKIVHKAEKSDFPYVVSLSRNNSKVKKAEKNHVCGGTLITREHVLTAAHCVEDEENYYNLLVKVRTTDLRSGLIYEIKWWATYNEYAGVHDGRDAQTCNDVAIVKLYKSVSSCIPLGILTTQPNENLYGKKITTAGWGLVENSVQPRYLRTTDFIIDYPQDCLFSMHADVEEDKILYSKKMLCSFGGQEALMQRGDSGSPLVVGKREIVGVNVGICFPTGDLQMKDHQNIHSSITYYRGFIQYVAKPGCIVFAYANKTLC